MAPDNSTEASSPGSDPAATNGSCNSASAVAVDKNPAERLSADAPVNGPMAQALRDIARGESAATALEGQLAALENRLDALLASVERVTPREDRSKGSAR